MIKLKVECFKSSTIESLSKILGHTEKGLTNSQISKFLYECKINDPCLNSTKWKRIEDALSQKQEVDRCANNIVFFIKQAMHPSRYLSNEEHFESIRSQLNKALSFEGLYLEDSGEINRVSKASTISEAQERADKLKRDLISRRIHPDVLHFCKAELLEDNYFHAVFEATKSIAEKIRRRTGLTRDGAALVDEVFSFKNGVPHLALNSLETESQRSEQTGFMNLIKGIFGSFRNTTAHVPKVTWSIDEQDALDILSTISLVHRRLDNATDALKIYSHQI